MSYTYLDDGFPEHEKVAQAGGDAAWLYVCGLCYVNRRLTGGRIPKAIVPQLSDRKRPMALAARLVEVRLWDVDGDYFVVHDYESFNRSAERKRQARIDKAKKAADARWHGDKEDPSMLQASLEHPPSNAQASSNGCSPMPTHARGRPRAGPPTPLRPTTDEHQSSSTDGPLARPPDDDEATKVREAAYAILGRRHLEARPPHAEPIGDLHAWYAEDRRRCAERHDKQAMDLLVLRRMDLSPSQLADLLEPPPPPSAVEALLVRQALPPCPACDSTGWCDTEAGVAPCGACERVSA